MNTNDLAEWHLCSGVINPGNLHEFVYLDPLGVLQLAVVQGSSVYGVLIETKIIGQSIYGRVQRNGQCYVRSNGTATRGDFISLAFGGGCKAWVFGEMLAGQAIADRNATDGLQSVYLQGECCANLGPQNLPRNIDIWVDERNGSDANPGSQNLPLATLVYALTLVPGMWTGHCIVHLKAGSYHTPDGYVLLVGVPVQDGTPLEIRGEDWDLVSQETVNAYNSSGGPTGFQGQMTWQSANPPGTDDWLGYKFAMTSGPASGSEVMPTRVLNGEAFFIFRCFSGPDPQNGDTFDVMSQAATLYLDGELRLAKSHYALETKYDWYNPSGTGTVVISNIQMASPEGSTLYVTGLCLQFYGVKFDNGTGMIQIDGGSLWAGNPSMNLAYRLGYICVNAGRCSFKGSLRAGTIAVMENGYLDAWLFSSDQGNISIYGGSKCDLTGCEMNKYETYGVTVDMGSYASLFAVCIHDHNGAEWGIQVFDNSSVYLAVVSGDNAGNRAGVGVFRASSLRAANNVTITAGAQQDYQLGVVGVFQWNPGCGSNGDFLIPGGGGGNGSDGSVVHQ